MVRKWLAWGVTLCMVTLELRFGITDGIYGVAFITLIIMQRQITQKGSIEEEKIGAEL